jgi:acetolactate synthase I/II/III large subunit
VRALARVSGAKVMCSPRAKGIFPEDHPQFLGVTGLGGHAAVAEYLRKAQPTRTLVLGSRLGEFTSFWQSEFLPPAGFMHVDLDPEVFGAAYPSAPTHAIQCEIDAFVRAVVAEWPNEEPASSRADDDAMCATAPLRVRAGKTVRPSYLMNAIQRCIVEESDAIVLTEAGNSFALGSQHLRFRTPGRYRVSAGFGSMGHATAGVLGAALAGRAKAVAIVGDGAMMMQSEVNTAVQYRSPAVWIVLNDARYGMIEQGMRSLQWTPFETDFPRGDFVLIAKGLGAEGIRVDREVDVDAALRLALRAETPFVVDVLIDPTEPVQFKGRNASLSKQGATKTILRRVQ